MTNRIPLIVSTALEVSDIKSLLTSCMYGHANTSRAEPVTSSVSALTGLPGLSLKAVACRNNPDARPQHHLVPSVVFSSPEVAVIGLTEAAAAEKHKNIAVYSSSFTCARSLATCCREPGSLLIDSCIRLACEPNYLQDCAQV